MKPMKEQRAVILVPKNAQVPLSEWLVRNIPMRQMLTRKWVTLLAIVRKLEQTSDFEGFKPGATYWIDFTSTHHFKILRPSPKD